RRDDDPRDGRADRRAHRLRGRDRLGHVDAERTAAPESRHVSRARAVRVRGEDVVAGRTRAHDSVVPRARRRRRRRERMNAQAAALPAPVQRTADLIVRGRDGLVAVRPLYVLSVLIAVQWIAVLALALTVRHNGWLYYAGGDQLWHYTGAYLI